MKIINTTTQKMFPNRLKSVTKAGAQRNVAAITVNLVGQSYVATTLRCTLGELIGITGSSGWASSNGKSRAMRAAKKRIFRNDAGSLELGW